MKVTQDIDGEQLACVSTNESDSIYRLFRKDGRVWVTVWVHFRPSIEGLRTATSDEIKSEQFANVVVERGKTLQFIVDAKMRELESK